MRLTGRTTVGALGVTLLMSVVLITAGCGGSSSSGTNATDGSATADASTPSTIKALVGATFLTLDPNASVYEQDWYVSSLYVGTLTKYGEGEQGQPELAEKLVPNKDFTQWTVTLKPGLKFSDGTPITAQDVAASFERVIEGEGVPFLFAPTLEAVKTTGPLTAVVSLGAPEPNFATAVSAPCFAIFPAAGLAEGESFFQKPVSAGPFVVDSYKPRAAKLSTNPKYDGAKPGVEGVEFNVVEDPGTRLAAVKTGEANWAFDLPAGLIPQISSPAEVQVQKMIGTYTLIMNNEDDILSDPKVRRGISYALDREAINKAAFGGEMKPNSRYWPDGPAGLKEFAAAEAAEQEPTANLTAAKRELVGTACESGCKLDLVGRSTAPWIQPTQLLIQQQLAPLGIEVKPRLGDSATTVQQEEKGEFQMFLDGFVSPVPAEEVMPYVNLDPEGFFRAGYSSFKSKKASDLITELAQTPVGSRGDVARELGDLYAEERPWAGIGDLIYINASNLPESVFHAELFSVKVE